MEYLSIKQIENLFDVNRSTVYRWFDRGLKKTLIGGTVRIEKKDLDEFIEKK
jgi:excisionase family DNA binding protein